MAEAATAHTAADDAATAVMPNAPADAHTSAHYEQESLFGLPIPVAAYTAIYAILAVTSLIEITLAELIPFDSWIRIPVLGGLSAVKAILVMAYYMHLKEDNKIFAAAIVLPIIVGLIATLFLIAVPATGY